MKFENGTSLQSKTAGDFSNLIDDVFVPEIHFQHRSSWRS
jgi:hypothetical protein